MNGLTLIVEPLFMLLLILASAAALYMGLFKAHLAGASAPWKWLAGILSGLMSGTAWVLMYSWYYLSW